MLPPGESIVTTFIALLRGINVGGTGLLRMQELVDLCSGLGLVAARTYIQSGNVIFESDLPEDALRSRLEKTLARKMGKENSVMVRTAAEMRAVLRQNPFPQEEPAKIAVAFLCEPPPNNLLEKVIAPGGERIKLGRREIYIYYPNGMGQSKLKLPSSAAATIRNVNTVAKLVALTAASPNASGG